MIFQFLRKKAIKDDDQHDLHQNMLNAKYTFDTFVIGSGNRFAHAASLAVAEAPAKAYNPLIYLWGRRIRKNPLNARNRSLCTRT